MKETLLEKGEKVLSGADAFKLYDTYGFPVDLTAEILEEDGISIDEDGFAAAMNEQKEKARKARKTTNYMGADVTVYQSIDTAITSEFVGYDCFSCESQITVMTTENEIVEALVDGQNGTIFTEQTPFYATSGGQEGDHGIIAIGNNSFTVKDTIKLQGGKIGHVGTVTNGMFKTGDTVTLHVDEAKRTATCKNHSATHLLQKALKTVLGNHVEQAGSSNNDKHLRFDFTHFSAMTADEIRQVEAIVNEEINAGLPVLTKVMDIEDARKTGAMALLVKNTAIKSGLYPWVIFPKSSVAVPMLPIRQILHCLKLFPKQV